MCYGNTSASPRTQLALLQASVLDLTETEIPPRRRTKSTSKATASADKSKTKTTTTFVEIAKKSRPKISPPTFHLSLSPSVAAPSPWPPIHPDIKPPSHIVSQKPGSQQTRNTTWPGSNYIHALNILHIPAQRMQRLWGCCLRGR